MSLTFLNTMLGRFLFSVLSVQRAAAVRRITIRHQKQTDRWTDRHTGALLPVEQLSPSLCPQQDDGLQEKRDAEYFTALQLSTLTFYSTIFVQIHFNVNTLLAPPPLTWPVVIGCFHQVCPAPCRGCSCGRSLMVSCRHSRLPYFCSPTGLSGGGWGQK